MSNSLNIEIFPWTEENNKFKFQNPSYKSLGWNWEITKILNTILDMTILIPIS